MKRLGRLLTVSLFAIAVWTMSANAAPVFYPSCRVIRVDVPADGVILMNISDLANPAAFTAIWAVGVTPTADQMLAIALTAMSVGNQVMCQIDLTTTPPQILRVLMSDAALP